ncbi:unnamed protein product [Amoebophrya sp. A120]|nr:unnamed protein product [Amoebophrya sp. A120]|eukprot:GSA120T00015344001.1
MNVVSDCSLLTGHLENWLESRRCKLGIRFDEIASVDDLDEVERKLFTELEQGHNRHSSTKSGSCIRITKSSPSARGQVDQETSPPNLTSPPGQREETAAPWLGIRLCVMDEHCRFWRACLPSAVPDFSRICAAVLGKATEARVYWRFPATKVSSSTVDQAADASLCGFRVLLHGSSWITPEPCICLVPCNFGKGVASASFPYLTTAADEHAVQGPESVAFSSLTLGSGAALWQLCAFLCEVEASVAEKAKKLVELQNRIQVEKSFAHQRDRDSQAARVKFESEKDHMIAHAIALLNEEKRK